MSSDTPPNSSQSWLPDAKDYDANAFSNNLLESLYHRASDAYLLVDGDGIVRGANQSLLNLFGYSREQIDNFPVERLIPASFRRNHARNVSNYFTKPATRPMGSGMALFALGSENEAIPVDISLSPVATSNGRLAIAQVRDRRDELRQADKFKLAEMFRLLVEGVADHAIILLDPEGRVTSWNSGAERNKGYRAEEIIGEDFAIFFTAEERQLGRPQAELARARAEGSFPSEGWRVRKDGSLFWASVSLTALHDASGTLIGFAKVTRDDSERMSNERQIHELNASLEQRVAERTRQLQNANHELESFAYAVSHDLRAPLRAILGFSQALEEDFATDLPQGARDFLGEIQSAGRRMADLIEGILQLSRMRGDELPAEKVDLSQMARRLADELSEGKTIRWTIEPGLHCQGDRRLLELMLRNLFDNAVKYSANRDMAEIAFFAESAGQGLRFHVRDNGAGFDMAHSGLLFSPFQRLHRQDEFPGLGIGLATVQRVVRRHGGEIAGHSAPNQGADFSFTLSGSGRERTP